jgi:hypothetical protein
MPTTVTVQRLSSYELSWSLLPRATLFFSAVRAGSAISSVLAGRRPCDALGPAIFEVS